MIRSRGEVKRVPGSVRFEHAHGLALCCSKLYTCDACNHGMWTLTTQTHGITISSGYCEFHISVLNLQFSFWLVDVVTFFPVL